MTKENNKQQFEECIEYGPINPLQDFDAVSLYPSAMRRLMGKYGLPIGSPKILSQEQITILNNDIMSWNDNFNALFIKVRVLSVGINYSFPLQSIKKEGVRCFTNNIVEQELYLDHIALEDLINFQKATVEIIEGFYFNEGVNDNISKVIQNLFNSRLQLKAQKNNPGQTLVKMIMNSSYGKGGLRSSATKREVINKKDFQEYFDKNYREIVRAQEYDTIYIVERLSNELNHFNRAHCASLILSMSKRIMNEVMCLAEDIGCTIYYQDTDSMHISQKDIDKLSKAFDEKYERTLIGKGMGQFHSDFLSDSLDGYIYSENFIALGKKCYIDRLRCIDEIKLYKTDGSGDEIKENGKNIADENTPWVCNNPNRIDYHIRMKGIPNKSIIAKAKELSCTPFELYQKLWNGETICFDLCVTEDNIHEGRFKKTRMFEYTTIDSMTRTISF